MTADRDAPDSPSVRRLVIAVLIIAAMAPYVTTLGFGYVMDDTTVIRSNPVLNGWGSLLRVWTRPYGGLESSYSGLYRPVVMAMFAFVWNAGDHWALWFHVTAVAMHGLATLLVFRLVSVAVDRWPATLAALWFAVHPVHVESVANVANSAEVLVAIWTCALALSFERIARDSTRVRWTQAMGIAALYAAAFLTKESGAVAPALAALWLWGWRRPAHGERSNGAQWLSRWWPVVAGCAAVAAAVFLARVVVLGSPLTRGSIAAAGLDTLSTPARMWAMLSLAPKIVALLAWPVTTNPHYGPTTFPGTGASALAAASVVMGIAVVTLALWLWRRGERRLLAAVGWTVVAFVPASNLLVATGQVLAERTLYVPSIGAAMLIALVLQAAVSVARAKALPVVRQVAIALGALVVAIFAARTARWIALWRNNSSVFAQMIAVDSTGYRGYWLAGLDAGYRGRGDEAVALLGRAYSLYPRDRGLLMDYSTALSERGDHRHAAAIAATLMAWPELRTDPYSIGLYLDALDRAYGKDSVASAARRLLAEAPSPVAAHYLERAVRAER
jgi:hypothetical protein